MHVADDAIVESGAPLFTIDPRPFELAVRQAEANLASAFQGVNASSASLVAAQADVTRARAALGKARSESDRTLRLEERGIVAAAEGDAARAAVSEADNARRSCRQSAGHSQFRARTPNSRAHRTRRRHGRVATRGAHRRQGPRDGLCRRNG